MTDEALSIETTPVVFVDGTAIDDFTRDVDLLEIRETTDGLKTLEMRVFARSVGAVESETLDDELFYLDGELFDFGQVIEVSLGSEDDVRLVFQGRVSAIEADFEEAAEPLVTVFAEDKLMELRLTRRVVNWTDTTDAQIAEGIAERHGLRAEVDADGPTYEAAPQINMSDLAFLRERGRQIQAEVWVTDDTLHFKTRSRRSAETIAPLVRSNDLLKVVARADLAHQRTAVRVRGYDADRREAIEAVAKGSIVREEIGGQGLTGPEVFERAYGKRSSIRLREVPRDDEQAEACARAEMLRRAREFVRVTGVTRGTPMMMVGARLELRGIGRPFSGTDYYVCSYSHTYDRTRGLRTQFDAERATINEG